MERAKVEEVAVKTAGVILTGMGVLLGITTAHTFTNTGGSSKGLVFMEQLKAKDPPVIGKPQANLPLNNFEVVIGEGMNIVGTLALAGGGVLLVTGRAIGRRSDSDRE